MAVLGDAESAVRWQFFGRIRCHWDYTWLWRKTRRIRCALVESAFMKSSIKRFSKIAQSSNFHRTCIYVLLTCVYQTLTDLIGLSFTNKENIVRPHAKKQDFTKLWQTFRANGSFISFTNKVIPFQHYVSPDRHCDLHSFINWAHFWACKVLLSLTNIGCWNAESSASRRRILLNYAESSRETQNPLM